MAEDKIISSNTVVNEDQKDTVIQETVQVVEVENIEMFTVDVDGAFTALGEPNEGLRHSLLHGREVIDQHPITAITGLRKELDDIEALKTVYSDKIGFGNYYKWSEGAFDGHGYFVSFVPHSSTVKICDGNDIFGVTVGEAGFIGNQNETVKRDNSYALVVTSGVADVRCKLDVSEGDYVVSNADGVATKTDSGYGYKVISIEEKNGVNYALISLGVQASTTDAMGHQIKILDKRMGEAETNITATMQVANEAHKEALKANSALKEALLKSTEALDKANSAGDNVQHIDEVLSSVYASAEQAKAIAESAVVGADKIRQEAVDVANEALDKAGELEKTVDPISRWEYTDPVTGQTNTGATYFAEYVKNGLNTKADMETANRFNEENKMLIEKNAENFQQMLSSVDKYSVGEYSQAYGLTLSQARNILKDGMVYIPTDHDGARTHVEQYVDGDKILKRSFTKGFYYVWTLLNDGEYMWSEEAGNVWTYKDKPAGNQYSYWYDGDKLYVLYNNEWIEVATIAGNTSNRITSMIRQTADNIALEVADARGSIAGLDVRIKDNESIVTNFASHVVGEYVTVDTWNPANKDTSSIYYAKDTKLYWYYNGGWQSTEKSYEAGLDGSLSMIEQKADDAGASLSLVVSDTNGKKSINTAGIVMSVNESGSDININANKINFNGFATFLRPSDVGPQGTTVIDGNRITTGIIQSHEYSYNNGNGPYSNKGTSFNLATGAMISENFVITDDGRIYVRGTVNALEGCIGNLIISGGAIKNSADTEAFGDDDPEGIYIGEHGIRFGNALTARVDIDNQYMRTRQGILGQFVVGPDAVKETVSSGIYTLFDVDKDESCLTDQTIPQRLAAIERRLALLEGVDVPSGTEYSFDILVGQYAKIPYTGTAPIPKYYPGFLEQPTIEDGYISFKAISQGVGTIIFTGGADGATISYTIRVTYGKHSGSYTVEVGKSINISGYAGTPTNIIASEHVTCQNNGSYISVIGNKVASNATIYVYVGENVVGEYNITVTEAAVQTKTIFIEVGKMDGISGYASDSPTIEIVNDGSEKIIECYNDGSAITIYGLKQGNATIKLYHSDTLIGVYNVTVYVKSTGAYTMYVGRSQLIDGYVGTIKRVECPSFVTYINNGYNIVLTGVSAGTGTVSVYYDNNVLAGQYNITVHAVGEGTITVKIDDEFTINYHGSSPRVTYPECVRYDRDDGGTLVFVGISKGTGTIILHQSDMIIGQYNVVVNYKDVSACTSHVDVVGERVEPTCEEDGHVTSTCSKCGRVNTQTLSKLGHKWSENAFEYGNGYAYECTVCHTIQPIDPGTCDHTPEITSVIAPTCTAKGYTVYKCSLCNYEWKDDYKEALGHNAGEPVVVRAATCTVPAEYAVYCTRNGCGIELDRYENDGEFAEHIPDIGSIAKQPTCTETGILKYHCRVCGTWIKDETIPANGHSFTLYLSDNNATCFADGTKTAKCENCTEINTITDYGTQLEHNMGSWGTYKEATCTEQGIERSYCQHGCGYFESRYTNKIAHSYNFVVTDPTCTTGGYTTYTCSSCGHSYTSDETEANGHNWGIDGGWSTVTPATCTTNGLEKHTCMTCLLEETREIIAKGHKEVIDEAVDATCTEDGWTEGKHCSVCGEVIVEQERIDALDHEPGEPELTNTPTCTVCAHYKVVCERCEETLDEYDDDGEFGDHSWGDSVEFKPTCTEDGYTRHICSVCNLVEDYDKTPASGHDYQLVSDSSMSSGAAMKCTRCGDSYEADYDCDILGHETNEGEYDTDDGTAFKCMHCGEFYN